MLLFGSISAKTFETWGNSLLAACGVQCCSGHSVKCKDFKKLWPTKNVHVGLMGPNGFWVLIGHGFV